MGEDAVAAAAVGDDLLVVRELGQPVGELLEGDVDGAGQVAAGVLGFGSDVEDHGVAGLEAAEQSSAVSTAAVSSGPR